MVRRARIGSVALWAWMVSVSVHLAVVVLFGVVRFPQCKAQELLMPSPTAKITRIKELIEATPAIPKPKVKKPSKSYIARSSDRMLPGHDVFGGVGLGSRAGAYSRPELPKPSTVQSFSSSLRDAGLPQRIEFFGSSTDERKVCYLVDCSGSMQGIFGRVRKELKESIGKLQPDQYFYIIFFGGGRLFESGEGRLVRATQIAKSAAYYFIDSIKPAGQTNALQAWERAVQVRDGDGASPSLVYFLTDGFEITTEGAQSLNERIAELLGQLPPGTRVNTIGFWPASDDRELLETMARQSGGESVIIADDGGKRVGEYE